MEFRELKYFLTIAREESISKAALQLYITQPNLTRQMQKLEEEFGQKLFVRGNKKTTLTDAGQLLRKRAEEIILLYEKTHVEMTTPFNDIKGNIYIGSGESYGFEVIAKVAKSMIKKYPQIHFDFFSGDICDVVEKLDKGLLDFGILIEPADLTKYNFIQLPLQDTWGILMRKDHPLANHEHLTLDDLKDIPLIRSKHSLDRTSEYSWLEDERICKNVVASYNLIYNASIMVKEGVGCALCLDKLVNTSCNSELTFVPLSPIKKSNLDIVWKKYHIFSKVQELFIKELNYVIKSYQTASKNANQ